MAASNLSAAIFIFSLLFFSTFSSAWVPYKPKPKPKPPQLLPPPVVAPPTTTPPATTPPTTPPATTPPATASCPRDTLKLGACVDLLGGVVNLVIGSPPVSPCCALLQGLADLEVAVCFCTAIKASVLGINLNVPVALSLLVTACGNSIPPGYQCG